MPLPIRSPIRPPSTADREHRFPLRDRFRSALFMESSCAATEAGSSPGGNGTPPTPRTSTSTMPIVASPSDRAGRGLHRFPCFLGDGQGLGRNAVRSPLPGEHSPHPEWWFVDGHQGRHRRAAGGWPPARSRAKASDTLPPSWGHRYVRSESHLRTFRATRWPRKWLPLTLRAWARPPRQ